jgi:hypothetical protein
LTEQVLPSRDGHDWQLYGTECGGMKFGNCKEEIHGQYNLTTEYLAIADLGGKQKFFNEIILILAGVRNVGWKNCRKLLH